MKEVTISSEEYRDLLENKIKMDLIKEHEKAQMIRHIRDDYNWYNIDSEFINSIFHFDEKYEEMKKVMLDNSVEVSEDTEDEDI